jgi:hypothetical protein
VSAVSLINQVRDCTPYPRFLSAVEAWVNGPSDEHDSDVESLEKPVSNINANA